MSPILARTAEIQSYVVSKATIATITTEGVAEAVQFIGGFGGSGGGFSGGSFGGGMGGGGGAGSRF